MREAEPKTVTPEAIDAAFESHGFVWTGEVATTLFLTETLENPLLLEGLSREL